MKIKKPSFIPGSIAAGSPAAGSSAPGSSAAGSPFHASPVFGAVIAVLSALFITVILIIVNSGEPVKTLAAFFLRPWSSAWFLGNTLDGIALLLTASLGAALAFRGGTFNLGGEGQIYLGGLAASVVLLAGSSAAEQSGSSPLLAAPFTLLSAAIAAMIIGGLMGGFSGLLKKRLGMNELITSFLFSSSLIPLADYFIKGPLRDKTGNLLALPAFPEKFVLSRLLPPSNLSLSFIYALILVAAAHVFINHTYHGYRYRISGSNPGLARFGGMKSEKVWIPAMTLSGAVSALAGFFAVAGSYGRCHAGFPDGLGWSAIAVALIARSRPAALIPAALIYGWLKSGSDSALLGAGMNLETTSFIQAAVLLFATISWASALGRFHVPSRRKEL